MAQRRVYLHPIRWTSLGLSLIEAMHLGMPVVALATTEVPEALPPEAGIVSTRLEVVRAGLRRLLDDPEEARVMGKAAREAAQARYGLERFLAAWVVLFALAGLYLLGFVRLEGVAKDAPLGLGRLLTAAFFLIFAISLLPGMFGGRLGELDAYVPPPSGSAAGGGTAQGIVTLSGAAPSGGAAVQLGSSSPAAAGRRPIERPKSWAAAHFIREGVNTGRRPSESPAPATGERGGKGRGGAGIVIDGCMRDRPNVEKLDLPLWLRGWTPNYHVQTSIYPNAVNVPIACGGVTVIPGDIIVADDDGVVVLPVAMAAKVIEESQKHYEWEVFSRMKLTEGAPLQRYYPLHPSATEEYEAWRKANPGS